jgi:hypothetical protein
MRTHLSPNPAAATWHAALFAIALLALWLLLCAIMPSPRHTHGPPIERAMIEPGFRIGRSSFAHHWTRKHQS